MEISLEISQPSLQNLVAVSRMYTIDDDTIHDERGKIHGP